jgi:hypothetical protein
VATLVFTDVNRIRRSGTQDAAYYNSVTPSTPNYGVEADLVYKSGLGSDTAGIEGRIVADNTFYFAHYNQDGTCWSLFKEVAGVDTQLGTYVQSLTAGQSYRMRLAMSGTSISLSVDGVQRITVVDASVTGTGRGGVRIGSSATTASPTNTTGMHLDNFAVTQLAKDNKGVNDGTFVGDPALGVAGAIGGDPNTAMRLDGAAQNVTVPHATTLNLTNGQLSIEAWIKRADNGTGTQTILQKGTGAYQLAVKNNKIGLYRYGTSTAIVQSSGSLLDTTAFHHVVATKTGATAKIYLDGLDVTTAGTDQTLVNTTTPLIIGGSAGEWFHGTLDEVAIYKVVLSAGTVAGHYLLGSGTDVSGPSGGSVDATGLTGTGSRYATSTSVPVAFSPGTDVSGLATTGRKLLRATAVLVNGGCGAYGGYAQVGALDPVSPVTDVVTDQACYSYQYVVADKLAHSTTYTSGDVKVDTTAPAAPALTFAAPANTSASGGTVFYRSGATSGSFAVTAAGADPASGIGTYTFGSAGAGWSVTGTGASRTYSWAAAGPATTNPTISATNNAGGTSPGTSITLTADGSAPSGGSVTYVNGAASTGVPVTFGAGTDAGSGLDPAGSLLQRAAAPAVGGVCGSYGAFTTIATAPASPYTDAGLATGCYRYQYVVTDLVGNSTVYSSSNAAQIDYAGLIQGTAGLAGYWRMGVTANSGDSFTDTAGTALTAHTGEVGAGWTQYGGTSGAVISAGNALRKTGTSNLAYYSSYLPSTANYAVEADLVVKSNTSDGAGLDGRRDPTPGSGTTYDARYDGNAGAWELLKNVGGSASMLDTAAQTLTVGATYRLRLDMFGTAIRMYVDGVLVCSATDASITAAGRAGIQLGLPSSPATTDTTGMHLDNFRVVPNTGTLTATVGPSGAYAGPPLLNAIGATTDFDSATQWNGSGTYADVPDGAAVDLGDGPFSLEAWIRRGDNGTAMQTILQKGTGAYQFGFLNNRIGLYKYTGGGPGTVIAQSAGTQTDTTAYHHYVVTKNGSAVKIYVDGADVTGTVSDQTLTDTSSVLRFGGGTPAERLTGYADEIAVYHRVLTPSAVTDHYLVGAGGTGVAAAQASAFGAAFRVVRTVADVVRRRQHGRRR